MLVSSSYDNSSGEASHMDLGYPLTTVLGMFLSFFFFLKPFHSQRIISKDFIFNWTCMKAKILFGTSLYPSTLLKKNEMISNNASSN